MLTKMSLSVILAISCFATETFAQCENGVCQMRTPLRNTANKLLQAAPVRSMMQAARPANWRVLSGSSASCSGAAAKSCSGQSVAPTACYDVAQSIAGTPAVASSTVEAQGVISDRAAFRRALKTATRNQVAAGNITQGQAFLLNGLAFFPAKADAIQAAIHDAAIDEGLATATAIDWDAIASFIERILPLILQLIQLFGSVENVFNNVDSIVLHSNGMAEVFLTHGYSFTMAA